MYRLIRFIELFGFVFLMTACPETMPEIDTSFYIINNSEEDILCFFRFEGRGEWYEINSIDSWLKHDENIIFKGEIFINRFNSGVAKANFKSGWKKYYIFNLDSVKNIPWQRICDERIILKEVRFDSWEDFERCNFEITYP